MIKNFQEILTDLEEKRYFPIYLLAGQEPYFIDTISNFISENVLNESERSFNQTVFYGKETSPMQIIECALRFPLMAHHNIVIVKEAQYLDSLSPFEKYFNQPNDTAILVICYKYHSIDKRTTFAKGLSANKNVCFLDSVAVKEEKIGPWIDQYLNKRGLKITEKANALLCEYLGADLNKISNELNKLILLKSDGKSVDLDDIEKHIGISKDYNGFELQNALASRNHVKAIQIFKYFEATINKNRPEMLTGILFAFFAKLHLLDRSGSNYSLTAEKLGINSWGLKPYEIALKNYKGRTEQILEILEDFDLRTKGIGDGGNDRAELLKETITKIIMV